MIDLMMYVIAPTAIVLAIYFYVLRQGRAAAQRKKQIQIARQVSEIKSAYKTTLEMFSMQRIIRPTHVNNLYAIVNNYFINQPITEEHASQLERLANRIAITIVKEVNLSKNEDDTEWLKKKLLNFTLMLPTRTRDYNSNFYQRRLNQLLQGLTTTRAGYVQRHYHALAA